MASPRFKLASPNVAASRLGRWCPLNALSDRSSRKLSLVPSSASSVSWSVAIMDASSGNSCCQLLFPHNRHSVYPP